MTLKIYLSGPGLGVYPEPLELFYLRALQGLGHEVVTGVAGRCPDDGEVDLSVVVKSHPRPWDLPSPRVLIFSDLTSRFPTVFRHMERFFDLVFLVHKEPLVDDERVFHLPLAMDPEFHRRVSILGEEAGPNPSPSPGQGPGPGAGQGEPIPLLFAGTYRPDREWLVDFEVSGVKPRIYGNGWEEVGVKTYPVYGVAKAMLYSQALIVLNCHYEGETENMRLHECMGYCSFQLTDLPGPYAVGTEVVTYSSPDDLRDKVRFYLHHASLRHRIAHQGHRAALSRHTYEHRMKRLLEFVRRYLSTTHG